MKTQIIFTCCRCGKEQVNDLNWFSARKFKYRIFSHKVRGWESPKKEELCNDCYRSLKIWLSNGDEYKELIDENNTLKKEVNYLTEQRVNLQVELKEAKEEFEHCKDFCPRSMPDYDEYMKGYDKWYKEKHKDDIQ